jgi:hypothetical protein
MTKKQKENKIVPQKTEIEKYDKQRVKQVRRDILTLKNNIESSYFELAKLLYEVYENEYFKEWGFEDFEEYCHKELEFGERKGRYLVSVWYHLVIKNEFEDKELEKLKDIGWTKVRALIRVVNKDNLDEWVKQATSMTAEELDLRTKQIVLEQTAGEEVEGEIVKEMKRFTCVLVDDQIKVVEKAFEIAEKIAKSDKRGHLLSLICLDFLSTRVGEDHTLANFLNNVLQKLEDYNKV